MTYRDTLKYLSSLNRMGIRLGLDPIRSLLERLDNPQNSFPSVLIAGTNGKGSVAAMTAAILSAGGFRTGLYTSPDLIDFRERIRIDGRMIGRREVCICAEQVKGQISEDMSYFEFLTAMAFLHFRRRQVDIAVLEIGMGGRLDATNVVSPLVSIITNISLDHREYLGGTLAEIAREKGGIIRERGICLTAARQKLVIETLAAICRERGAALYRLGKDIRTTIHRDGTFSYRGIGQRHERLICPLAGRHQFKNAALALGAVELLGDAGYSVPGRAISEGLKRTRWEGRLEVLRRAPLLLVDGAHNPAGVAVLCRALERDFPRRRLFLIFGVMGDKDYLRMAKRLFPLADRVFLTCPYSERVLPPAALLPAARRFHPAVEVVENPGDALQRALSLAGKEDLVCAAGSLYLVGEIKKSHGAMIDDE
ncbi:MAG: bifunctional folylpolyglutamate synthase/dihydrofolate synthase [Proteobacteria bacterium]|nr:bifunctional folylpolyglutamate synthase/dihydrofolate synthase [Pseudomonadota bacterium]MBU2226124.1 bifunctional folylpolyglutamate synthase/dihydrofolate synthase [Pseudomonadota bacterium]MBU2262032.1 bifunctional folylpolyglutamate synthase/dihydrofolate synthase [Pseudomonadota bacterium]